jgi:hypothetical protein
MNRREVIASLAIASVLPGFSAARSGETQEAFRKTSLVPL